MKAIYRMLILVTVFIGSLVFFGQNIPEKLFSDEKQTLEMPDATFPEVRIQTGGEVINTLQGYASNLDEMIIRECITPIESDRTFTVLINENENTVKKLKYEIYDEGGGDVESGSMIVLDQEGDVKSVKLQLQEPMKSGKEYVAKLTLITNQSKRIYYYTRLKAYDNGMLSEKLDFVRNLHESFLDKEKISEVEGYLEPLRSQENTDFAHVDIHSSTELISWGELQPEVIYMKEPVITEFYENMASVVLNYVVSVQSDSGTEYYNVKECFRFSYSPNRSYLYNYDRKMDAMFREELTSLAKSELKLGITNQTDIQIMCNQSDSLIAFVYGRELLLYRTADNTVTKVFSFYTADNNDRKNVSSSHDIKILSISEEGVIDFIVYGYMGKGEYEGRVAIVLYRFYMAENRIEEQAHIPITSSYQQLSEEMTDFFYRNDFDVFYFSIYNSIYSYNIVTRELEVIADDVPEKNLVYCVDGRYLAWQDVSDNALSKEILIYMLETGDMVHLETSNADHIQLLGAIDENLVCGYAKIEDTYIYPDGEKLLPCYRMAVCDSRGSVKKQYAKNGYYITDVSVDGNVMEISRITKKEDGNGYLEAEKDYVLNEEVIKETAVGVTERVTELMLMEHYIRMPDGTEMRSLPELITAQNTVIDEDTTMRVSEPEEDRRMYYAYSFGEIIFTSTSAGEAIRAADEMVGTVINEEGRLVWERGVKSTKREITDIQMVIAGGEYDSTQACMKMLFQNKNIDADTTGFNHLEQSVDEWMGQYLKVPQVNLTGVTLDEALYYVYKQRPVIAFRENGKAVLITAYDATNITVMDPTAEQVIKYTMKNAAEIFEAGGNRFFSYLE